ncbi:MAG: hypothetical protein QOE99_2861 [Actinomycetota bacterium]|jgi:hypothetical protein|nr:hypothetical protein [Actinomycetota bacterium]
MGLPARRFTAAVTTAVASTALVAAGLVAWFAPAANASAGVQILPATVSTYLDSNTDHHVVGELQNTGTTNIESIQVDFVFFDTAGTQLGTDFTNSALARLAPGEKSSFHEVFTTPAGYDHYTASVSAMDAPDVPNHNFTADATIGPADANGLRPITGTVRNDNTTDADFVNVVFTFYNGSVVVNEDDAFVNDDTIAPGGSSVVESNVSAAPAFTTVTIRAESNSPAAPNPSASPSPSPSVSASASPSASPSPGASSSPTPSATASTEVAPTVALASSVISAGQHVIVTYTGTPGSTLTVLSKTQPATSYSPITTVVLDAAGHGTTSHAPTKNTRIMAQTASGLASGQPLIQVRSVASINAKRIGVGAYTFTGRVYPARTGRLVSLYRNGVLVAQGHTDAIGIYTITKKLALGTFSFLARTSDDTYNRGTTSPARSVAIS